MASQQQLAVPRVAPRMWFRDFFAIVAGVFAKFFPMPASLVQASLPAQRTCSRYLKIWRNRLLWGQNAGANTNA